MPYDYDLIYKPSKDNPADFMSRHPSAEWPDYSIAENYANYIASNAMPKAKTLREVKTAI